MASNEILSTSQPLLCIQAIDNDNNNNNNNNDDNHKNNNNNKSLKERKVTITQNLTKAKKQMTWKG